MKTEKKPKCGRDDLAPSKLVLHAQRKENKKELLSEQNFKIYPRLCQGLCFGKCRIEN